MPAECLLEPYHRADIGLLCAIEDAAAQCEVQDGQFSVSEQDALVEQSVQQVTLASAVPRTGLPEDAGLLARQVFRADCCHLAGPRPTTTPGKPSSDH